MSLDCNICYKIIIHGASCRCSFRWLFGGVLRISVHLLPCEDLDNVAVLELVVFTDWHLGLDIHCLDEVVAEV
jgi:hypothetical protein